MCTVRLAGDAAAAAAVARTFYSSHAAHQCETDDKKGPSASVGSGVGRGWGWRRADGGR